ncbi:MAG: hypothetical protein R3321_10185 [Nitrososphaeraceae archaeon]|nr:hypothetical protein [Nitrososphaeraceae archaeon]
MNELNKNDTLILLENYPRQCIDCISTDYEILFKDKIYFYDFYKNLNFIPVDTVEFQTIKGSMSDTIFSSAIEEFRYLNKKGLLDLSKLKELGTDSCLGGANKMVTIITGNGDIKSYYVKCFLSQEQRFYYQKY